MANSAPVPRYHLYGEEGAVADFDFFHIETIKARSQPLGWSLGPHSHLHLFQCLMITAGHGRLTEETGEQDVHPDVVVFTPPGAVHGWEFTPDTEGYVVSFTHDYLVGDNEGHELSQLLAARDDSNQLVVLPSREVGHIRRYMAEMAEEFASGLRRRLVFRPLMTLMLARLFASGSEMAPKDVAPGFSLFRFRFLVDQHFRQERAPEFYAGQMGLTVGRLNSYCRMFTDRTAAQSIRDRIILEAKRQLTFSNLSISEIAYDLGFDDPAYFSRVFRKENGESPQEFRALQKT
jgi:AraC family transcriptional activator of pobA